MQLCQHRLANILLCDDDDTVRVAVPRRSFEDYLDMVVTPLRRTCPSDMAVMLRLSEMLADVGRGARLGGVAIVDAIGRARLYEAPGGIFLEDTARCRR